MEMNKSLIESLNWRYATKEFDPNQKLSHEQLSDVLEALRLSTSSFGLQPWKFVMVENKDLRAKLLPVSWNQKQVVDASHLIVMCIPTNFGQAHIDNFVKNIAETRGVSESELDGYKDMMSGFVSKMDDKSLSSWMKNQVYIAMGHLLSACALLKIDACPMEGFTASAYNEILGLDEKNLESVLVCPIGFRSEDDKYAQALKVRFPKEEILITL